MKGGKAFMLYLDPDKLYLVLSGEEMSESVIHEKKLQALFWDIIEVWEDEKDIDYSVPLDDVIEMVKKSPQFYVERRGVQEMSEELFAVILQAKSVGSKRRRVL